MNKKLMVAVLALSLGASFVGCASGEPAPEGGVTSPEAAVTLTSEEVYAKITEGMEMPSLQAPPAEIFSDVYGMDTTLLTDYIVMQPMMSGVITEIGVFQVADPANVGAVVEKANARLDALKNGGAFYPSHVEIVEKGQVVSNGNYVLFVADEKVDTIVANFNALFAN